jgi:hypothetical protein
MQNYLCRHAWLVLIVVVLTTSAAIAWSAQWRGEPHQARPKAVTELVERLKERDPGLHIVACGVNPNNLESGAYVADHPITDSVRTLTLSRPEDWAGIVLIRPGNGSQYLFPPGVAKERTLATDTFFMMGDPALLLKIGNELQG